MTLVMDMVHWYQISFEETYYSSMVILMDNRLVMGVGITPLIFASFQDLCPAITVFYYY
jgi:hypothetical protein